MSLLNWKENTEISAYFHNQRFKDIQMIKSLLTPPILYLTIAFALVLGILIWSKRSLIRKEMKRWRFKELNIGPLKLEREGISNSPTKEKAKKQQKVSNIAKKTSENRKEIKDTPINNLPEKLYTTLIGRDKEIEEIINSLKNPKGKRIIGIYGMGGVGKSSLAREVASRVIEQDIFSAVWWTTAKIQSLDVLDELSADKTVSYDILLSRLASWLGLGSELRVVTKIEDREHKIQKTLSRYKLLFILDNMETSIDQNEIATKFAKLITKTNCKILLTSREAWERVPDILIDPIPLQGLSEQDGINLLLSIAQEQKNSRILAAKNEQLLTVTRSVKNMPLALKLVAGLLKNHDLSSVISNIEQIHSPKIVEMYEYLFASSWRSLSIDEKNMLIALSQFDEDEGTNSQLLKKAEIIQTDKFDQVIDNLAKMSLIEVSSDNNIEQIRYTLHPLTLNFIRSKSK